MSEHPGPDPFLSVIIPSYNAAITLPEQLQALANQTFQGSWELLIVDNGSTDATAEVARGWIDRLPIRVINAHQQKGINYARNAGAGAARGTFLLFCDADDVAEKGWLAAMAEVALTADLVGGRLDDERLNDSKVREWRDTKQSTSLDVALRFLPYAVGANCGVRADVLQKLGGFDERHAVGAADVEFFWRAQLAGYELRYVHEAVISYRYRQGLKSLARQFYRYGRAEPQLYRRFRAHGLRRSTLRDVLRTWAWILFHTRDILSAGRRGVWLRKASYRWGRLVGSARFGVIYL